jgi:2-polyprenyl-6-hydroxyphenyl methylase/3-demethylubiquinone-9 3-methyltransferase
MVAHQALTQEILIWGVSLPTDALGQADITYMGKIASIERPSVEWLWQEMDRVWDVMGLDNRAALQEQTIGDFYSHPVWVMNGVFSAVDPVSVQHRDSIAAFIGRLGVERVADYGGGFGELALRLRAVAPQNQIDIVEPYPSKLGMLRVVGKAGIQFVHEFNGQYDCVIAQDVLEHVEQPLDLIEQMVHATKPGGYLIFANCFYPVIKCHLPSTFYLRHTFSWVVRGMGLKFEGRVEGVTHGLVFKRDGNSNKKMFMLLSAIAKLVGPFLNAIITLFSAIRHKMRFQKR